MCHCHRPRIATVEEEKNVKRIHSFQEGSFRKHFMRRKSSFRNPVHVEMLQKKIILKSIICISKSIF